MRQSTNFPLLKIATYLIFHVKFTCLARSKFIRAPLALNPKKFANSCRSYEM